MSRHILICDCLGSQEIDAEGLARATGVTCSRLYTSLCQGQIGAAAEAMRNGPVTIACRQEAARFADLAAELDVAAPSCVDVRDRAGWSDQGASALPKMAALVAQAGLDIPVPRTLDVVSAGTCLIVGPAEVAQAAAAALADTLAVTLLLGDAADLVMSPGYDSLVGRLTRASGSLGRFSVAMDGLRQIIPGGRGAPQLTEPRDGAVSDCDVILDLTCGPALFSADDKRDGYLRADPKSQPAVAAAVLAASQLVGTFEKTLYVRMEPALCAHSRAEKPACSRCLDLCPTGAITSAGEHVSIDPLICAGCGACSAVCPSGAIAYDAPPVDSVFLQIRTLAAAYLRAGGEDPRLLVHDDGHGAEMIRLAARYGRGLPADVIPLEVGALAAFGHSEILAALSCGFAGVDILLSPRTERDALIGQTALANALAGTERATLLDLADPDAMADHLYAACPMAAGCDPVLPIGSRRQVARLAAKALRPDTDRIDLPAGAPYGAVLVDTQACTLCLSCVSLCPSGALGDNPDMPQLRFQEDACLQCGLCANICPEKAITLKPQMDLTDAAFTQTVLHEEEPFACIECGALFGVKSTVDRIMEKLAGKHAMFATSAAASMIQMCDNCRVKAQFHSQDNSFAGGERPRVRTSDDYPRTRKDH